jgi:hypothetical protein
MRIEKIKTAILINANCFDYLPTIEQDKNYIGVEIKEEIFNAAVERLRSWLNE